VWECSPCFPSKDRVCFSDLDALISSIFPVVCVEIFPSQQAVFCLFFFFLKLFGTTLVLVIGPEQLIVGSHCTNCCSDQGRWPLFLHLQISTRGKAEEGFAYPWTEAQRG